MSVDPYRQLVQLAETELGLVEEDRIDELDELYDRGAAIAASLPEQAPTAARAALEQAGETQARVTTELAARLAAAHSDLARLRRGRDAAHSYAATAATRTESG
jgi:hypothetical protein